MNRKISKEEFDELSASGTAKAFIKEEPLVGWFCPADEGADSSILLVSSPDGYFIRDASDLVYSTDGFSAEFIENIRADTRLPTIEEVIVKLDGKWYFLVERG